jgi:hypothetical protein
MLGYNQFGLYNAPRLLTNPALPDEKFNKLESQSDIEDILSDNQITWEHLRSTWNLHSGIIET